MKDLPGLTKGPEVDLIRRPSQEGLGNLIHLDSLVQNILLRQHNASHVRIRITKGMKLTAVVARETKI